MSFFREADARLLRALWMFARRAPCSPWNTGPEWQESDSRNLAGFMETPTGRKLAATMRNEIASANERAAMSKGSAFECGWACGYRGLFAWFQALSAPSAVKEENTEADPFGETGDLEHLSP